jgi:hypothetical protein
MPDNAFEDGGVNDYIEVLKAVIGGLDLLVDTLMGNSVDGVETTPEEQRQVWEDGKAAGRLRRETPCGGYSFGSSRARSKLHRIAAARPAT